MLALTTLALAAAAPQNAAQDDLYTDLQTIDRVNPIVRVVQAVAPAVVFIETEIHQRVHTIFGPQEAIRRGAGSGVVVHPAGFVVTNYHVVEGAREIQVSFDGDPNRYRAELASFVREEDLALLKIVDVPSAARADGRALRADGLRRAGDVAFPTVRMGTSADLLQGETVVAIGNPHGQTHTVSTGIISGLHREVPVPSRGLHFRGLIQTDASINLGNSGGPLLNVRGELIGINTAMNEAAENIGFAIPVDRVRRVLTDVLFPQARRSWLGFEVAADTGDLVVERVWPGSPADEAGICEGARLLAFDGEPVEDSEEYLLRTLQLEPGQTVGVEFEHDRGTRETVSLEAWDQLDGLLFSRMGVLVSERSFGGSPYVLVDRVRPESPADRIGVRRGDLLPAVQPLVRGARRALRVRDKETLAAIVESLPAGTAVEVDVYRDTNRNRNYERGERLNGTLELL